MGDPGPPLNRSETKALLDQVYRLTHKPPIPTSSRFIKLDIENTQNATHVYVKAANPQSLCPKWEGPYAILSRPSRSQVTVKLGLFANGDIRSQTYHWSSCRIAHMREEAIEGTRPKLGRPSATVDSEPAAPANNTTNTEEINKHSPVGAKIQTDVRHNSRPTRTTRNTNPLYVGEIYVNLGQVSLESPEAPLPIG